jgi:two-component system cell cycle sensor histidine kinase/response regulator CckA
MTHMLTFLDSPPEEAFDRMTRLAARLLGAPISLIALAVGDRQIFKSSVGLPEPFASRRSTPSSYSFCRHVIESGTPLVVEDARRHPLVRTNPAIRELGWISYAGVPLVTGEGRVLGALSVIDGNPRLWSERDITLLQDLAASVVTEIELRRALDARPAEPDPGAPDPAANNFETAGVAMALFSPEGRWLRVNQALCALLDLPPDRLLGRPVEESFHPDDWGAGKEAVRLLLAGECTSFTAEKRLLRGPGEAAWVLVTVTLIKGPDGAPVRFHLTAQETGDRKQAELALQQSEERCRLAARVTEVAVWEWDLLTDRITWDESAEGTFGYAGGGFGSTAAWWYERLHGEDRERVVAGIHQAIADGDLIWADEYRFRRADGSYAYVSDRAAIVRDAGGDAIRMVGAVADATERHRAELLARGQSQLLEQIAAGLELDAVLERICRFTEAHGTGMIASIMLVEPGEPMLRLASAPSLSAAYRAAVQAVPIGPDAGACGTAVFQGERAVVRDIAMDSRWAYGRELALAQGLRAAWVVPFFGTAGRVLGSFVLYYREPREPVTVDLQVVEIATHLTEIAVERERNQQALSRSTRLFVQVLENLPVGVGVLDRDGRITFENPASLAIWGVGPESGLERCRGYRGWQDDATEPIAPDEWPAVKAIQQGETTLNQVVTIEGPDGVQKSVLGSAVPLRSTGGEILGAIALSQDITEWRAAEEALRRSQEQLQQAQKMEAVGQLAGGIAHDFNNLLTGMLSYSELILHELHQDDPIRADLEQIRQAAQRAAALTRQLLAFSRRQVLQPKIHSLNSTVAELDGMLRRLLGAGVALETELDPGLWYVLADPSQLEQVLVNLVVNARDAMPGGGQLTILTENALLDVAAAERANGMRPGAYVRLTVRDTGVGMDVPTQARIFDPFFTTKETGQGTGLGLSTVYGIVEQSGGHIAVESAPGHGAAFTIYLPRHEGPGNGVLPAVDRRGLPGGSETLLLVEDEAAVRSSARRLLERHGYTVIEARHGADGLRIVEQGDQKIDLVLTDLVMPEMGGRELVERLRARHPALKVLFMSGYSQRAVTVDGAMPPATGFVEKPFTVEQLTHRLREILDG